MTHPAKKTAFLLSENLLPENRRQDKFTTEFKEQLDKLVPAFIEQDMSVDLVNWREAPAVAKDYDAMLPLFAWDYFEGNENDFLSAMAQIEQETRLFNNFKILKWNADKTYLDEMESLGAATIPTIKVERVTETDVLAAMDEFGCDKLVIKPDIGAAAWRQALYERGAPFPAPADLPPRGALLQPFLKNVVSEGEYSYLYFGGMFSHALRKRPKQGDYRIQGIYGGTEEPYTPGQDERAQVRNILNVLDFTPLYARVDLLRGDDNRLLLIELEMIEPYLYLPYAEGEGGANKGAQKLAMAVAKKLMR